MYSALSTFNTTTEVLLSKAPNPQLLPGRRSINGCPLLRVCVHGVCVFTAVCVHLGWVKCRALIPSMGHHTWSYHRPMSLCHRQSLSLSLNKIIVLFFLSTWFFYVFQWNCNSNIYLVVIFIINNNNNNNYYYYCYLIVTLINYH